MPDFLTPSQYFHQSGARPRKHFGQHFLAQPATAARIAQSAELADSDIAVEIGPGLGALTRHLLPETARLHLVEIDPDMASYLRTRVPADRVVLHEQDVLDFDFSELSAQEDRRLVLLGNLPYNISSPLLFHLLECFPAIDRAVFMVQKEVGSRFAASPGSKDYGVLSVLLGIYGAVRALFTVGPGQFYPPPKVDSLVLRIDFAEEAPPGPPFAFLRKFVSLAFQKRRKTLQNSLKGTFGLDAAAFAQAFSANGIDPQKRPETLTPAQFLGLADTVYRRFLI